MASSAAIDSFADAGALVHGQRRAGQVPIRVHVVRVDSVPGNREA
jgi:hypothetical protein